MQRKNRMPPAWIDPSILYSRQEIAERVGLTDDVLSFWIRRRLLVPEPQEGSGKGVHHRFHFSQVNIAVALKALRDHFGANIATLKSLSGALQGAVRLFRSTKAPVDAWGAANRLADYLGKFRNGEPPVISPFDEDEGNFVARRPAASEAEIIGFALELSDASPAVVLRLAETLGPDRSTDYEIAMAILGVPLNPRYSAENYWLLSQMDGKWIVRYDTDQGGIDRSNVGPAMFLPIYAMVRQVWGIPSGLTTLDGCERLKAALKDAGVEATVTPAGERSPNIALARDEDAAKAQDVYLNFFKPDWQKERDGDDFSAYRNPRDYDDIYWLPDPSAAEAEA